MRPTMATEACGGFIKSSFVNLGSDANQILANLSIIQLQIQLNLMKSGFKWDKLD